jgi:transcriptional regulator with XRE-family HTH domain
MSRRHQSFDPLRPASHPRPLITDAYFCDWGLVVGDRVRRLRRQRDMTLKDLAVAVPKPDGYRYSMGFFSRLERGSASGPLIAYSNIADVLEIDPGRLLGPDDAQREVTDAEMTLLRVLRRVGVTPDEAIVRLVPSQAA